MKLFRVILSTCLALVVIDLAVAGILAIAARQGVAGSLVRYFDYGYSVPGKQAEWLDAEDMRFNPINFAWRHGNETQTTTEVPEATRDQAPAIRTYGMSFVRNIMKSALTIEPDLNIDQHSGPAAPPNYTYTIFHDDRASRNAGDVVILGILSSSVVGMAALSNETWNFEQPSPFTYPIYLPAEPGTGEADGAFERIEPLISSEAELRATLSDPERAQAWRAQQRAHDHLWTPAAYWLPALDISPFARLVRRALATGAATDARADVISGGYPYAEVLRWMITDFAQTARADGQVPIVFLIQSRDPRDPDVLEIAAPVLASEQVAYLATAELFPPNDTTGFVPDGHYRPAIDQLFAEYFLSMPELNALR